MHELMFCLSNVCLSSVCINAILARTQYSTDNTGSRIKFALTGYGIPGDEDFTYTEQGKRVRGGVFFFEFLGGME